MRGKKRRPGFTLVELMAVIAIIGLLGMAAYSAMGRSSEKSKYAVAASDITTIGKAFDQAVEVRGNYNGVQTGTLDAAFSVPALQNTVQQFMSTQIADLKDPWGSKYCIQSSYNNATGAGKVFVYVQPDGTTDCSVADPITGARLDAMKNKRLYRMLYDGNTY